MFWIFSFFFFLFRFLFVHKSRLEKLRCPNDNFWFHTSSTSPKLTALWMSNGLSFYFSDQCPDHGLDHLIIIIIIGSYNTRRIYPIGYSGRCCGSTAVQPKTYPHNVEPEIRNRILWEGVWFLVCRRKLECPEKTYQGGHGIGKPNSRTTTGNLSCIGERPSVRAPNQPALPQG